MEKWIRNKNVARISAVLLALLLWVVVHLDEQVATTPLTVSDQIRSISDVHITTSGLNDENFFLQSVDPEFVNVELKGREAAVNQVRFSDGSSKIQLDLSSITAAGEYRLPLQMIGFPAGVQISLFPAEVTVQIEEIHNKEVPVHVELTGEPAEGFIAGTPIVSPIRAIVSVPSSSAEQIVAVKAVIDITGANETIVEAGKLVAVDENGEEVKAVINPAVAEVELPITSPFKTIPLQVRMINQPAEGFSVASFRQNINEVTVYGPDPVLDELDFYPGITVDLSGLTTSQQYQLEIPLMEGLHLIHPESISINIEIVPSETRTLQQIPIIISGANQEYVTRITNPESAAVDIVVSGAPNVLNNVSHDNVQAIVDVSNLPQGTHELTLRLNLPSNVKFGGAESGLSVTVEIIPIDEVALAEPADLGETDSITNE